MLTFVCNFREKGNLFFNKFDNTYYCASEIFGLGHVTFAADWWSCGSIVFEILTGMVIITYLFIELIIIQDCKIIIIYFFWINKFTNVLLFNYIIRVILGCRYRRRGLAFLTRIRNKSFLIDGQ